MIRKINREPQIKTTIPSARLHSDYWGPYPIDSIKGGCKYYVFLINEVTGRASIRPIVSKKKVRPFLIHEIRKISLKNRRAVVSVRLDNAKEYESAKSELWNISVTLKFVSIYTQYQNGLSERFNRIIVTIARFMLIQSGLPLSF